MIYLLFCFISSKINLGLNDERQFLNWMRTHATFYVGEEYQLRFGIFLTNLRYIQNFNRRKGVTFRLGINKFACYTPLEYKSLLNSETAPTPRRIPSKNIPKRQTDPNPPDSFDWRDKNIVNDIRDQGQCGSGYAFATICSVETGYAFSTGPLLSLSEQNIIDCDIFTHGCNGGYPQDVYIYIHQVQGDKISLAADYPYKGAQETCHFDKTKAAAKFTYYATVIEKDENDLKERVAWHGPAAACITSSSALFQLYSGGIINEDACKDTSKLDHVVAVIGYGADNDGAEFWIARNSWGAGWGEKGYARIARNKGNVCGIASRAIVAITYDI